MFDINERDNDAGLHSAIIIIHDKDLKKKRFFSFSENRKNIF